jgi:hypothetical protein
MANLIQDGGAITYIHDCQFTIQGAGADDGNIYLPTDTGIPSGASARTLSANSVTFKVDEVGLTFGNRDEDHSQGQSLFEFMRGKKKLQSARFSRKLEVGDAVAAVFAVNDLIVFTLTGVRNGAAVTDGSVVPEPFQITGALAKVGEVEGTFNAPSTMTFTLGSYGRAWA